MLLPHAATVIVTDGETVHLFRNDGDPLSPSLAALPAPAIHGTGSDAGTRHHSGAANPSDRQLREDGHAAATAAWLNAEVISGRIQKLLIIAAPKTLGELRRHYHTLLADRLVGEIAKELTGHRTGDIAAAIAAA